MTISSKMYVNIFQYFIMYAEWRSKDFARKLPSARSGSNLYYELDEYKVFTCSCEAKWRSELSADQ